MACRTAHRTRKEVIICIRTPAFFFVPLLTTCVPYQGLIVPLLCAVCMLKPMLQIKLVCYTFGGGNNLTSRVQKVAHKTQILQFNCQMQGIYNPRFWLSIIKVNVECECEMRVGMLTWPKINFNNTRQMRKLYICHKKFRSQT